MKAGGEGDGRGWDGLMASLTHWTWVWARSLSWWWTGKSGMLQSLGSQKVGHDWAIELNWTDLLSFKIIYFKTIKVWRKSWQPVKVCFLLLFWDSFVKLPCLLRYKYKSLKLAKNIFDYSVSVTSHIKMNWSHISLE